MFPFITASCLFFSPSSCATSTGHSLLAVSAPLDCAVLALSPLLSPLVSWQIHIAGKAKVNDEGHTCLHDCIDRASACPITQPGPLHNPRVFLKSVLVLVDRFSRVLFFATFRLGPRSCMMSCLVFVAQIASTWGEHAVFSRRCFVLTVSLLPLICLIARQRLRKEIDAWTVGCIFIEAREFCHSFHHRL